MATNWYHYASPVTFYPLAGRLAPWFAAIAALLAAAGLWIGFGLAPTDATQGEAYRIIYIHVPTAWMAMFVYLVMAFWSALALAFNTRLSAMMSQALAPTGALMASPIRLLTVTPPRSERWPIPPKCSFASTRIGT